MEWDAGEYGPYCMAVKVSFFPCLFGGMWGCPQPCLESPQKELGEVEGVAVMWQAVSTNRKEGLILFYFFWFCFHLFPFAGFDFFFRWGRGRWKKSTKFWFGEVVDDHVQQQVPVGQTEEGLAQTTAL